MTTSSVLHYQIQPAQYTGSNAHVVDDPNDHSSVHSSRHVTLITGQCQTEITRVHWSYNSGTKFRTKFGLLLCAEEWFNRLAQIPSLRATGTDSRSIGVFFGVRPH